MDEDDFFKANGNLPPGVLGAFEVAGKYNDPAAISCGVNAWGGTVGVYGECFIPGSPYNAGDRKAPAFTGVCGRSDGTGVVGEGAFFGGRFGSIPSTKPNPVPLLFGCTVDCVALGMSVGSIEEHQPLLGAEIQAVMTGLWIGRPAENAVTKKPIPPPIEGIDIQAELRGILIGDFVAPSEGINIQATKVGVSIGQDTSLLSVNKVTMPAVGVNAETIDTAFKGHSRKAEALNAQSDQDRGGVFGSKKIAQLRLLPSSNVRSLPAGQAGDLYVSSIPNTPAPKNRTQLFLCLGTGTNGKSLWAPLVLGPIQQGG